MAAMAEKHTHYRDYRDVRGDGRIILYRRADIQSPNWTARLKIPNTVGYVVKSAKTPDDFKRDSVLVGLGKILSAKAIKRVLRGAYRSRPFRSQQNVIL